ncbi:uncharacterized protein FTOL_02203 [Fusarium torulosum]|uniref:Uncharacterized protein n=1 Tax=Fusarium torulosum TaxID=33205 RepID=A0AAE8M1K4_9HYPO|nr:uncharacterized protein FTOL_02203 [Fusarium torulosum]
MQLKSLCLSSLMTLYQYITSNMEVVLQAKTLRSVICYISITSD